MTESVITLAPSTDLEALSLDGLALNDGSAFDTEALEIGPPPKRILWLAARDGDALGDVPGYERRTIVIRLRPRVTGTMAAALDRIGQILDKLQEAERTEGGIALTWTPAASGRTLTAYVLVGEITGMPISVTGEDAGWFVKRPPLEIRLDCKPFLYGAEVTVAAVTNTDPLQIVTLTGVTGDVPAEGRLIVTPATQSMDHVEWGAETGTTAQTATDLILDSDELTIAAYSGTGTTRSGAYDPGAAGNSVIQASSTAEWVGVCSTGNQTHVGSYRVKARVYATSTDVQLRFAWRAGDAPHSRTQHNTAQVHLANQWIEVDLGLIYIPTAALGTQRWEGIIETRVFSNGPEWGVVTATVDVDVLYLIPVERYGKARAPLSTDPPPVFSARSEFDTEAGAIAGDALAVGGTWTGAGDADDFTVAAGVATRTAVSDAGGFATGRIITASTPTLAAVAGRLDFKRTVAVGTGAYQGLVFRYVDINNFAFLAISMDATQTYANIYKIIAGSAQTIVNVVGLPVLALDALHTIEGAISAAGEATMALNGQLLMSGGDSVLATGGTLDDGKVGIGDWQSAATVNTRTYDNFAAWALPEGAVAFSGQSLEVRHDDTLREDSTGTYWGRPPIYRGSRFFISQAGDEAKVTRVVTKARRNDVDVYTDDQIADSTTAQVKYVPRFLAIPRS